MNRITHAILAVALLCAIAAPAQEKGNWRAANKSAKSITGDLAIAPEKLTVDFVGAFPIAQIRPLTPAEIGIAFDADAGAPGTGNLYRINVPAAQKFLNKNTLCAGDQTQWMATYLHGKSLELAFFSGAAPPQLTPEAFANPTNLCGIFAYSR